VKISEAFILHKIATKTTDNNNNNNNNKIDNIKRSDHYEPQVNEEKRSENEEPEDPHQLPPQLTRQKGSHNLHGNIEHQLEDHHQLQHDKEALIDIHKEREKRRIQSLDIKRNRIKNRFHLDSVDEKRRVEASGSIDTNTDNHHELNKNQKKPIELHHSSRGKDAIKDILEEKHTTEEAEEVEEAATDDDRDVTEEEMLRRQRSPKSQPRSPKLMTIPDALEAVGKRTKVHVEAVGGYLRRKGMDAPSSLGSGLFIVIIGTSLFLFLIGLYFFCIRRPAGKRE